MDAWVYFLRHAAELEVEMLPHALDTPEIRKAMQSLAMLAETDSQREVYEGRLKMLRDEHARLVDAEARGEKRGHSRGHEEGLEQGEIIGRIAALQDVLGQEPTPREVLRAMTRTDLERLVEELKGRLGR